MDIRSNDDLISLLQAFYLKVRNDELLGPIFTSVIQIDEWDAHIIKLSQFWSKLLFETREYSGNPVLKHREVDKKAQMKISQDHFNRWLLLWENTIHQKFSGENALKLIASAQRMSSGLLIMIVNHRK